MIRLKVYGNKFLLISISWVRISGLFRSRVMEVYSVKDDFDQRIRYRVHDGHHILFGMMNGLSNLKSLFPCLFVLDRRQHAAAIVENFQSVGGSIVWDFLFH